MEEKTLNNLIMDEEISEGVNNSKLSLSTLLYNINAVQKIALFDVEKMAFYEGTPISLREEKPELMDLEVMDIKVVGDNIIQIQIATVI